MSCYALSTANGRVKCRTTDASRAGCAWIRAPRRTRLVSSARAAAPSWNRSTTSATSSGMPRSRPDRQIAGGPRIACARRARRPVKRSHSSPPRHLGGRRRRARPQRPGRGAGAPRVAARFLGAWRQDAALGRNRVGAPGSYPGRRGRPNTRERRIQPRPPVPGSVARPVRSSSECAVSTSELAGILGFGNRSGPSGPVLARKAPPTRRADTVDYGVVQPQVTRLEYTRWRPPPSTRRSCPRSAIGRSPTRLF
jgi:hypothetical protein